MAPLSCARIVSSSKWLLVALSLIGLSACQTEQPVEPLPINLGSSVRFLGMAKDSGSDGLDRSIATFRAIAHDPFRSRTRFATSWTGDATAEELVAHLVALKSRLYPQVESDR